MKTRNNTITREHYRLREQLGQYRDKSIRLQTLVDTQKEKAKKNNREMQSQYDFMVKQVNGLRRSLSVSQGAQEELESRLAKALKRKKALEHKVITLIIPISYIKLLSIITLW